MVRIPIRKLNAYSLRCLDVGVRFETPATSPPKDSLCGSFKDFFFVCKSKNWGKDPILISDGRVFRLMAQPPSTSSLGEDLFSAT